MSALIFIRSLFYTVLLVCQLQLVAGKWTFSLRIFPTQCCDDPAGTCEVGRMCGDSYMAICLRYPNRDPTDRQTCRYFIAGSSANLTSRELTSHDIVDSSWNPKGIAEISDEYRGGVNMYVAVITIRDIPPYEPDEIVVDELVTELETRAGGEEARAVNITGDMGNVVLSASLSVECIVGYWGNDCSCNRQQERCTTSSTLTIIATSTITAISTPLQTPPSTSSGPSNNDTLTVAVGGAMGGIVMLLAVVITITVIFIFLRRRRDKKSLRIDLSSALKVDHNQPQLPPTIPPSDVIEDGVTYTTVVHNGDDGYHNMGCEEEFEETEQAESGLVYAELDHATNSTPPSPKGITYVEVDHERATYTTFKNRSSPRRSKPFMPPSSNLTTDTDTKYVAIKQQPSHKYMNVPRPNGDVAPQPKPRNSLPVGQQNIYSSVPNGI